MSRARILKIFEKKNKSGCGERLFGAENYFPTVGYIYILTDSGLFRILTQWDIFMYIREYSEPMDYWNIFRTVDIFSSCRHYTESIYAYAKPYLSRFSHIYNPSLFRYVMFHAYSCKFTKLHISGHVWRHRQSDISRILALPVLIMKSNISFSSQVLLLNHCSDLFGFGTFFHFLFPDNIT